MKHKFLTPIITPFHADESVNYDALAQLTCALLQSGADGIYAGGSSAECFLLTEEERKKTLETVIEAANGAFVVAHVGAIGTHPTLELAKHAKAVGANALSSVPPFYFSYPFEGILDYYRRLADVGLPVIVYSLPAMTRNMTVEEYKALLSIDGVVAIKYTDTDYFKMEQVISATNADVYSGKDENFLAALSMGARGAIGTSFNYMVDRFKAIFDAYSDQDTQKALALQRSANDMISATLPNLLPATKYLVKKRYGIDCGASRSPFTPLTEAHMAALDEAWKKLDA